MLFVVNSNFNQNEIKKQQKHGLVISYFLKKYFCASFNFKKMW